MDNPQRRSRPRFVEKNLRAANPRKRADARGIQRHGRHPNAKITRKPLRPFLDHGLIDGRIHAWVPTIRRKQMAMICLSYRRSRFSRPEARTGTASLTMSRLY